MQLMEHRDCEDATIWSKTEEASVASVGGLVPDLACD